MLPGKLILWVERGLMSVLTFTLLLGLYLGFFEKEFFTTRFSKEDGEIEYATVFLLLLSCLLVVARWINNYKTLSYRFTITSLLVFITFFFVAGEEISWGQRILGLESTEYFKENNSQAEMNLHNLMIGEVKINKLIFGLLLTVAIVAYMILLPFLYQRINAISSLTDRWYVPVPRLKHSLGYLILTLVITIIPASKNWELLEFGSVLLFFLVLWNPSNEHVYKNPQIS